MNRYLQKLSTAGITAVTAISSSVVIAGVRVNELNVAEGTFGASIFVNIVCYDAKVDNTGEAVEFGLFSTEPRISGVSEFDTSFQGLLEAVDQSRREALNEIDEFQTFSKGWDGCNSDTISPNAIEYAKKFLREYDGLQFFSAYADPDGSVGLQAELQGGRVLLSFGSDDTIAYLIRKNAAAHRGHGASQDDIERLLKSFA